MVAQIVQNAHLIQLEFSHPPQFEAFWFENVDPVWWQRTTSIYWKFPFYVCVVYLALLFYLQSLMKNREAFQLQKIQIVWNLSMSLFCFIGFVRITPELFHILSVPGGFHRSICVRDGFNRPAAFWGMLWCMSKYLQLADTLIIVLRKKPLHFLYWYHHSLAVIVPWQVAPYIEPIARWTGVINYFVLSLMYLYFGIHALKIKIPRGYALFIAVLHVVEMLISFYVHICSAAEFFKGTGCARVPESFKWTVFAYGSFLILFSDHLLKVSAAKKSKED